MYYGLGGNSLFLRFFDSQIERSENWRVIREFHEWGQPLVVDLQFMSDMLVKNANSMCSEIQFSFCRNRLMKVPLQLHLSGYNPNCYNCSLIKEAKSFYTDINYYIINIISTTCSTDICRYFCKFAFSLTRCIILEVYTNIGTPSNH